MNFPLNANGKIDKKALPSPNAAIEGEGKKYILPCTETEIALSNIWQEILNREFISVDDNFFEIGGHSLLATMMMTKIQAKMDVKLKLKSLFMNPTIEDLAAEIEALRWLSVEQMSEQPTEELNQFVL
jgi:acyl carrier protein